MTTSPAAIALLKYRARPVDQWMQERSDILDRLVWQADHFPSIVLYGNGELPAAVVGVVYDMGVGTVWMITFPAFETEWRTVLKQERELMHSMVPSLPLHRLQMVTDSNRTEAHKWALGVGFIFEAKLEANGPRAENQNIYIWKEMKGMKGMVRQWDLS